MRKVVLIAGVTLVGALVAGGLAFYRPVLAVSATLPCNDPRGCPDLTVTKSALYSAHIEKATFSANSCAVVEGMTEAGERKLLLFPYKTPNLGPGALAVGNPADHPELFEFASCHNHYHFREYADYRLWTPQGYDQFQAYRAAAPDATAAEILKAHPELRSQLVEGTKRGFCLLDYKPAPNFKGTRDRRTFVSCATNQGIGVGWADEYTSRLDGQWIDVTDVAPGNYVLDVETNAERVFTEANYRNNSAAVPVEVR